MKEALLVLILLAILLAFVGIGVILPADGNSLLVKLNAALSAANRGNNTASINSLDAFVNQVNALTKTGKLTAVQGQSLIDQATVAISTLGGK